jgi:hypothetical protein
MRVGGDTIATMVPRFDQRIPYPVPVPGRDRPRDIIDRALAAHFLAYANGRQSVADFICDDLPARLLLRSATAPATTATSGWAAELAQTAVADVISSIAPVSAGAALIGLGLQVPFENAAVVRVPGRVSLAADAGGWTGEGLPLRVRRIDLSGPTLTPCQLGAICVFTNELADHSLRSVQKVAAELLNESAALLLDSNVLGNAAASPGVSPAGLLNGVSGITAATGGGINAMVRDVEALIAALAAAGGGANPVFVAAPGQAAAVKMWAGPKFDYPVLASAALAAGTIVAVEAKSFVSGFSATPTFDTSDQTVVHLEDTSPAQIGTNGTPNVVAAPLRSLWQTNSSAVKMILRCSWGMRAPGHVQFVSSTTW